MFCAKRKTLYILIVIIVICITFSLVFIFNRFRERSELSKLDDSRNYLIDISKLLGSDWIVSEPFSEQPEDMTGWSETVLGHSTVEVHGSTNSTAQINLHVIAYVSQEHAQIQYSNQEDWIFTYQFGVPPSRQISKYIDLDLSSELNLRAEKYRIACKIEVLSRRCNGLLLYGNHVVFLDAFTEVSSTNHTSDTNLAQIFKAIDEKMVSS